MVSVVLYHTNLTVNGSNPFSGGYLGVDVFFVISGYLITSILLNQLSNGTFSFAYFYERRARRILPALFTVMLASIPLAIATLLPKPSIEFAGSVLSSLFFGSNFWFWLEDSYTAEPSLLKPFLHTWSLSIEEQFYLLFPACLLLLRKLKRPTLSIVFLMVFIASLVLAQVFSALYPDAAFYLIHTRAWELLAGSFMASLSVDRENIRSSVLTKVMPVFGFILIITSFALFSDQTRHPSLWTLFPVLGTMLIIWFSNKDEPIGQLLSWRPIVAIGLISYSLYLWHFTIFAFARIIFEPELSVFLLLGCIAISVALSWVSYRVIEKPCRDFAVVSRVRFVTGASLAFLVISSVCLGLLLSGGLPERFSSVAHIVEQSTRLPLTQEGKFCRDRAVADSCVYSQETAIETLVLVGDSHAGAFGGTLIEHAADQGLNLVVITEGGCPLLPKTMRREHNAAKRAHCERKADSLQAWLSSIQPATLIYTAYFTHYLGYAGFDNPDGTRVPARRGSVVVEDLPTDQHQEVSNIGQRMIRSWLALGHKVVVVYPIPETLGDVPKALVQYSNSNDQPGSNRISSAAMERFQPGDFPAAYAHRAKRARQLYDDISDHPRLIRLDPAAYLCSEEDKPCKTHDIRLLYYADDNHMSPHGAEMVLELLREQLAQADS